MVIDLYRLVKGRVIDTLLFSTRCLLVVRSMCRDEGVCTEWASGLTNTSDRVGMRVVDLQSRPRQSHTSSDGCLVLFVLVCSECFD